MARTQRRRPSCGQVTQRARPPTRGRLPAPLGSSRLLSAPLGSSRLPSAPLGSSRLLSAPLGYSRLLSAPLGSSRLLLATLGYSRLPMESAARSAERSGNTRSDEPPNSASTVETSNRSCGDMAGRACSTRRGCDRVPRLGQADRGAGTHQLPESQWTHLSGDSVTCCVPATRSV